MINPETMESLNCSIECNSQFRQCLNSGEDESICRMEWVPCDSKCSDEKIRNSSKNEYLGS